MRPWRLTRDTGHDRVHSGQRKPQEQEESSQEPSGRTLSLNIGWQSKGAVRQPRDCALGSRAGSGPLPQPRWCPPLSRQLQHTAWTLSRFTHGSKFLLIAAVFPQTFP